MSSQFINSSSPIDPMNDTTMSPSTVAMLILFGSIIFATMGIVARVWHWGDMRAIFAAISIKINSTTPNNNLNNNNNNNNAANQHDDGDEHGKDSRSVSSRISSHTMGSRNNTRIIRPWEPTFISTFTLLYQSARFGLILFMIYFLDNYPPYGASRLLHSTTKYYTSSNNSDFDEDQFVFWMIVLVAYGYTVSWQRNDGRPVGNYDKAYQQTDKATESSSASAAGSTKSGKSASHPKGKIGQAGTGRRRRNAASSSVGSKSTRSSKSGDGSDDFNKRLDNVLLDDDDSSFETILGSIGSDGLMHKGNEHDDWSVKVSRFLGLHYLNEKNVNAGVVQDVKPEEDVLNRHQTLEWKGLLSAALLIYQFNNGGIHQTSWNDVEGNSASGGASTGDNRAYIYENLCNVAMSSFLFLTGYGHTFYYYYHPSSNNTYRMSRVLGILCRINLAAIFLSLLSGKMEYMACPMITYCFLLVWLTMSFHRNVNYDKYQFRLKLLGLAFVIFIIWDCDISNAASRNIAQSSLRPVYEWYCQSYKHHWAAFMGIIFAINQPIASWQLRKLESLHLLIQIAAKGVILLALGIAVLTWSAGPLHMSTIAYNISHPYFGIIPVLGYIYLRNICSTMREHQIGMLSSLGKYSLEIYLLHHHAFTDSGCILFLPGYPRCNFLLVTMLLLWTARALHNLTTILMRMLLPEEDDNKCIRHSTYAAVGVTIVCVSTNMLVWAGMANFGTICTISIVCAILIYQTVMDKMWTDYRDSGTSERAQRHKSQAYSALNELIRTAKFNLPLIGTVAILIAWCVWSFSSRGVWNFSSNALHPCGLSANEGHWIHVDPCLSRGRLHREFHATDYLSPEECSESKTTLQWTWDANSQHMSCGYHYHNDLEVKQKLQGKRVVLIGDGSVRSLFQSLCRLMGDYNAGGSEGVTHSHSDAMKTYGSTTLEYKWAPLSMDIVTKLKSLQSAAPMKQQPSLIIAGGGAWDKLHLSVTDEDPQSHQETVLKLVRSLSAVNLPVVWFTPPTINTQALNSDDKRTQMSEEQMAEMRQMYMELGVPSSVSFVLDGPSFTFERVSESFDGIHYPAAIYDAGAQILFNALDWIIPNSKSVAINSYLPKPGSLGNAMLGLMMICIALIGLFFFDGYFGISYLAQAVVMNNTAVSPGELYDDAFAGIFKRLKVSVMSNGQDYEKAPDESSLDGGGQETTELLGRSSSSLSRRR